MGADSVVVDSAVAVAADSAVADSAAVVAQVLLVAGTRCDCS